MLDLGEFTLWLSSILYVLGIPASINLSALKRSCKGSSKDCMQGTALALIWPLRVVYAVFYGILTVILKEWWSTLIVLAVCSVIIATQFRHLFF